MSEHTNVLADFVGEASYAQRNAIIKECLRIPGKRVVLDDSLAESIANDVYNLSLARIILEPQIVQHGQLPSPVQSDHGPVVGVWLREEKNTVVVKNAFRDSVEEEVRTTVKRRLSFVESPASAMMPSTFQITNTAKFKSMNLNGSAYSMVDRARERMAWATAVDETKLVMLCVQWMADNVGAMVVALRESKVVERIGRELAHLQAFSPSIAVLGNPKDVVDYFVVPSGYAAPVMDGSSMTRPIATVRVMGATYPVYAHFDVPEGRFFVLPVGRRLGSLAIAKEATVAALDKRDKFLTGWTCGEEIGLVLANAPLVTTVFVGTQGLLDWAAASWRRMWRRKESVVEKADE